MPEDVKPSEKTLWATLPKEMVLAAPLVSLLKWMDYAENTHHLPVPEDYPNLTESELKQWIIAHILAAREVVASGGDPGPTDQEKCDVIEIPDIAKKFQSPYELLDYLSAFKFFIPKFDLLPPEDIQARCIEFLKTDTFREEYEKAQQNAFIKKDEARKACRNIVISSEQRTQDVTEMALAALEVHNNPPFLFVRSGELIRITSDENGMPRIEEVDLEIMRHILRRAADFFKLHKKQIANTDGTKETIFNEVKADPPIDLVKDLLATPTHLIAVPSLYGIIECPTILRDNTLIQSPGYNYPTRLYYAPQNSLILNVPEQVSYSQAIDAYNTLKEIFVDFPFDGDASRENCIAALITAVIRPMITGPIPMVILDKPVAGTGASKIAEIISIVACGRVGGMMSQPMSEEEWGKKITAVLSKGKTVVIVDNIESKLYSASLASVITSSVWEDRKMGSHEMTTLPNISVWIGTGNNIGLGGDMPRRCFWVRLDPQEARPWQRTGFKHEDLIGYVTENRGKILSAILTIARGWIQGGCIAPAKVPLVGSFESWRVIVGGIMEYLGANSFLGNLEALYAAADSEAAQWDSFTAVWFEIFGKREMLMSEVSDRVHRETDSASAEYSSVVKLFDVLPDYLAAAWSKNPKTFGNVLGKALARKVNRVYPNGCVIQRGDESHHATRWLIAPREGKDSQQPLIT